MMPNVHSSVPLSRHAAFASSDVDQFRTHLAGSYCDHRILSRGRTAPLNACHNSVTLGTMSLNYLRYGAEVEIDPGMFDTFYMLELPCGGRTMLSYKGETFENRVGTASLISPSNAVRSVWSADCEQLMVKISRTAMERILSALLGAPVADPLVFRPSIDLTSPTGRSIRGLVQFAYDQFEDEAGLFHGRRLSKELENLLISTLLQGHAHNYSDRLARSVNSVVPKHVKKAIDYIDSHLQDEITIVDLVEAAGVSGRTLFNGFSQFTSMSPLEFVRMRRMHKAREDLRCAAEGESVAEIAMRWGFNHLGRFSANYKAFFGEKPSDTLRR